MLKYYKKIIVFLKLKTTISKWKKRKKTKEIKKTKRKIHNKCNGGD